MIIIIFTLMEKKESAFSYYEINGTDKLDPLDQRLISKAKSAAKNAWAPYSGFHVGAAVLLANGEIITGNNQENAASPSGLCAERTALFYANSQYPDVPVKSIAITAFHKGKFVSSPVSPCGSCRQVMLETQTRFKNRIRVLMYSEEKIILLEDVSRLLPFPFSGF